jgi:flagellar motor switch protein FliN/FliY
MDKLQQLIATDHISLDVTIRLGHTKRTVAQLAALKAEDILVFDQSVDEGLEICVGDTVIARGELTADGTAQDRLHIRILKGEADL